MYTFFQFNLKNIFKTTEVTVVNIFDDVIYKCTFKDKMYFCLSAKQKHIYFVKCFGASVFTPKM